MAEQIKVNFDAKKPSGIKLLNRFYDCHLILNDIGVRLDDQLTNNLEVTVPNADDIKNLNETFGRSVTIFNDLKETFGDVQTFVDNFGGETKQYAEKLVNEMIDFNNGVADIADTEGGLAAYDDEKLNDWVNNLMGDIVETNEAFNLLVQE